MDFIGCDTFVVNDDGLKDKQFEHIVLAGVLTVQGLKRVAHFPILAADYSSPAFSVGISMVADRAVATASDLKGEGLLLFTACGSL